VTFTTPAAGRASDDPRFQDFDGELVALVPLRVERDIPSSTGDLFDAVIADTYVVTGPWHRPAPYAGSWWMGKALLGQLVPVAGTGQVVLGRLGKPEGKRYWLLGQPTADDVTLATKTFPALAADTAAPTPATPKAAPPATPKAAPQPEPVLGDDPPF
jgi:hypothetical protein